MKWPVYGMFLALGINAGLGASAALGAQDKPPGSGPSARGTEVAYCVLQISFNREALPLNAMTISSLANSAEIRTRVAEEVARQRGGKFGMRYKAAFVSWEERPSNSIAVSRMPAGSPETNATETILGGLSVEVQGHEPDVTPAADAILKALQEALRQTLEQTLQKQFNARKDVLNAALIDAKERLRKSQYQQWQLCADAGMPDLSREAVTALLQRLENDTMAVQMELIGKRARRDALARQIAEVGQRAAAAATEQSQDVLAELEKVVAARAAQVQELERRRQIDVSQEEIEKAKANLALARADAARQRQSANVVIEELEKVVAIREEALQRSQQMVAKGLATRTEFNDVAEQVAQARAELAKQRQAAAQAAGGAVLPELNVELARLAAEIADAEARQDFLDQLRKGRNQQRLMGLADQYEYELRVEIPIARQAVETLTIQLQRLQNGMPLLSIEIIGGVDSQ